MAAEGRIRWPELPVVLLHGLGANREVWRRLKVALGDRAGPLQVIDLPGHGAAAASESYLLAVQAEQIATQLPPRVHILAHSLGAALGFVLAAGGYGVQVQSLFGIGLKLTWSEDEVARMRRIHPVRVFPTREEAAQRFLLVSGLAGWVEAGDPVVDAALVSGPDGYRLAADPRAAQSSGLPIDEVIIACRARGLPFQLATGDSDTIASAADALAWDPGAVRLAACGHNAHVEQPAAVAEAYLRFRAASAASPLQGL